MLERSATVQSAALAPRRAPALARSELPLGKLVAVAALALVIGGVALVVRGSGRAPDGVSPIAWHREPCAHCQMLIGEPAFAAQLATTEGEVLSFDDPGCALRYTAEHPVRVHRLWFHHSAAERWLRGEDVGFVGGATTPMGFGLAAVERTAPGAIDLAAARERVRAAHQQERHP